MINKAQVEIPPKFNDKHPINPRAIESLVNQTRWIGSSGLSNDVRYYGEWMLEKAKEKIGHFYPNYKGKQVIAWIWARAIQCPNPSCGIQMPLVSKFWLSTHTDNQVWANPIIDPVNKVVSYKIEHKGQAPTGTITKSGAVCINCGTPVKFDYIRSQGQLGKIAYQLLGISVEGEGRREYYAPEQLPEIPDINSFEWTPETDLPPKAIGFRVQKYGITQHKALFTPRQLLALVTFSDLIKDVRQQIIEDSSGDIEYADAVVTYLAICINRLMQTNNTLVRWLVRKSGTSKGTPSFDRPVVSMTWEFSEGNVFSNSVGSWIAALNNCLSAFKSFPVAVQPGTVIQRDAAEGIDITPKPVISTDPPYFDYIGYSDLSDFYYIWMRRSLRDIYPDILTTILVPKEQELTLAKHLFNDNQELAEKHFTMGLQRAFEKICTDSNGEFPTTIYYAFKQTEKEEDD